MTQATLEKLLAFRKEREWEQFHSPKNVSMALSVEAAELMEIFQWASDADTTDLAIRRRKDIEYEVADIAILLSYFCHDLGISLNEAVEAKIEANREKYPVEKAKGSSTKYNRL